MVQELTYQPPPEASKIFSTRRQNVAPRTAVVRAIEWLQSYAKENPASDAANEARSIINALKTVHHRAGVDTLLALIVEIAKTDQGLREIEKARIRISQREAETGTQT